MPVCKIQVDPLFSHSIINPLLIPTGYIYTKFRILPKRETDRKYFTITSLKRDYIEGFSGK